MSENNQLPYKLPVEKIYSQLNSREGGITSKQAAEKREKYGKNIISGKKQKSLFRLVLDQVNNPVIYLLLGAVVISLVFGDVSEAIAIFIVILLNTMIGFWMEYQARTSVNALKKLNKLLARVVRDDNTSQIDASEIVPGDIILLEAGDIVPADCRVVTFSELKVDESPLTGESFSVEKNNESLEGDIPLAEQTNMLFKGTAITHGKSRAIVTATGNQTEIGKISEMAEQEDKDDIPLNMKLRKLSHNLIWVTLGLAALFFVIGWLAGKEIYLMLQTAIAWTVAAIPEGLPIVASIALARGMLRLSKKNVIVKKLAAVETLGETTVIFTDKTGTLTENKLTLESIEYPGDKFEAKSILKNINDNSKNQSENKHFRHIFNVSVFCNDASENEEGKTKGDPLDVSLLQFFTGLNSEQTNNLRNSERINEDPFDSDSKFMGTIHLLENDLYISAKGAAEPILSRCAFYLENGNKKKLNNDFKKKWLIRNEELSEKGLKVIAFSYKTANKNEQEDLKEKEDFVEEMTFLGLISFIDPAREDVKSAIKKCKKAGIKIVMVTGDHPGTAENIAGQVELADDGSLDTMKGNEIDNNQKKVYQSNLFARVDPEQKFKIVEHFRNEGEITAMTGDGVNDAPALKKADIGIAMGGRGTQIAQDVADMILKDDSFPSIVNAIEQGRIIFGNIRKFIIYQLSYHLAEIVIIAGISFSLFYLPLLPLQLLFLNLLSDVFPALALGLGKGDESIMKQKPKNPKEPIINKRNWLAMGIYGFIMAAIIIGLYLFIIFNFNESKEIANTIAFFTLAISQLLHVFNMRDASENVFNNQIIRNPFIWIALVICTVALAAAYLIPSLREILSFESLKGLYWLLIGGTSILILIIIQIIKNAFKI